MADTFILLGMAFDSPQAAQLNKEIFETIYYAALDTSCKLAEQEGIEPPFCRNNTLKLTQKVPAVLSYGALSIYLDIRQQSGSL